MTVQQLLLAGGGAASGGAASTYIACGVNIGGIGGDTYFGECSIHNSTVSDDDITALENGYKSRWGL